MGYIYKITNLLNDKAYIGQTITSISIRMNKHYSNAKKAKTGIDAAIKKYGREHFLVEEICSCPNEDLDEWEKYYIEKFNTYKNGYNLTIDGKGIQNGSTYLNLNETEVINKYLELKNIKKTSEFFNCCELTISNILHNNNIKIYHTNNIQNILGKGKQFKDGDNVKAVEIIELNKQFKSLGECSQWLLDNGYSKAKNVDLTRKSLSRALNGDRKTYCGLHFKFI